ncbi:MAG: glycosyltransferase family 4 protein, partial [Candidatus Micrarchaeota archaeon]|nr:glycosyltransferase family 4 protein [Candidatus Micrarchaeota archaeon]
HKYLADSLRIAFVSDAAYPWNVGGLELVESIEARELAKRHEVHFFSFRWPGMKEEFRSNGITYHTFHEITKEKFYRHGRRSIREAIAFGIGIFALFGYKFDLVYANEFPVLHLPVIKLYCMLTGAKLVLDVVEVWDRNYWVSYLGPVAGSLASAYASTFITSGDSYIANSTSTAKGLEGMGIPSGKIHVFSPIIDDRQMARIRARQTNTIIFSGRLIKEKRVDRLIDVVKSVSRTVKGLKVLIIGEGPEAANIKKQIRQLKLDSVVKMRGFYSEKGKANLYRDIKGAKMLLHMSEREGLGIIALESLALGTPVVLPSYSPIPDEVKRMCVVADETALPAKVIEILRARDKGAYLRNGETLKNFYASNVNKFYSDMFKELGLIE